MAMFDGLVLEISVVEFNETLHATLYRYELVFIPSGVSVVTLSAENRAEESILVRNTLLQVTPGRQIAPGPILHNGNQKPL